MYRGRVGSLVSLHAPTRVRRRGREARTLNGMSGDEAARAGVEGRRSFFRVDNGKANMAASADQADWHRLVSVALPNGDNVGVVTQWTWPNAFDCVSVSDLRKVQAAIANGRWRENSQARDLAGVAAADVLELDVANKAHRAKITALLNTWIKNGMFVVVEGLDERRAKRSYIEVGKAANVLTNRTGQICQTRFEESAFHGSPRQKA
jgi:hypothetical protein